ncbi:hypothetical protein MTO96_031794 [Rhipicephalus appendiculatus]
MAVEDRVIQATRERSGRLLTLRRKTGGGGGLLPARSEQQPPSKSTAASGARAGKASVRRRVRRGGRTARRERSERILSFPWPCHRGPKRLGVFICCPSFGARAF